MFVILAYLSALLCFAGAFEIKQVDSNDAHLVETSPSNYAVSSPKIIWKTLSINGDQVTIIEPNCQVTLRSLSENEQDLVNGVENELSNVANNQGSQVSYKISRFSTDGSVLQQKSRGININKPEFNSNVGPSSISKSDEDDFSIARPGLPMNLARVFVKKDVVTFVSLDGQVKMKPTGCLEPSEKQLISQLQLEVRQAEEESRSRGDNSPRSKMFGGSKDNRQINDNPLSMLNNWDNMFVPPIPNPVLIPPIEHVHPPYNSYPGQQPGLNPMNMFHHPHQPIDDLALQPLPAAPYRGESFNELARDTLNVYNPIRTYNNLQMGDANRGFH